MIRGVATRLLEPGAATVAHLRLMPLAASFSNSASLSKKKKLPKERDPIPTSIERLPLEETLPTDDGEPRPGSVGEAMTMTWSMCGTAFAIVFIKDSSCCSFICRVMSASERVSHYPISYPTKRCVGPVLGV